MIEYLKIIVDALRYVLTFQWLWDLLRDIFFWILDILLQILILILNFVMYLMPSLDWANSGLSMLYTPAQVIGYLNWIAPMDVIGFCLSCTGANLVAYNGLGWALRWAKVIR